MHCSPSSLARFRAIFWQTMVSKDRRSRFETSRGKSFLNLYWISAAIEAHIPCDYRTVLFDRLLQLISQEWASWFQQCHVTWTEYLDELEQRRMVYAPIGRAQGGEIAVATQAGAILEDNRIVRDEDRTKVLALMLDLVPLDRYGAILDDGF